jgi:hypothetical protein
VLDGIVQQPQFRHPRVTAQHSRINVPIPEEPLDFSPFKKLVLNVSHWRYTKYAFELYFKISEERTNRHVIPEPLEGTDPIQLPFQPPDLHHLRQAKSRPTSIQGFDLTLGRPTTAGHWGKQRPAELANQEIIPIPKPPQLEYNIFRLSWHEIMRPYRRAVCSRSIEQNAATMRTVSSAVTRALLLQGGGVTQVCSAYKSTSQRHQGQKHCLANKQESPSAAYSVK